jgi:hypothetical protein
MYTLYNVLLEETHCAACTLILLKVFNYSRLWKSKHESHFEWGLLITCFLWRKQLIPLPNEVRVEWKQGFKFMFHDCGHGPGHLLLVFSILKEFNRYPPYWSEYNKKRSVGDYCIPMAINSSIADFQVYIHHNQFPSTLLQHPTWILKQLWN